MISSPIMVKLGAVLLLAAAFWIPFPTPMPYPTMQLQWRPSPQPTRAPTASPRPTPRPTPTPNPYRRLEFGTPTLGGEPVAKIAVLGGWAAVKRDGRRAQACISFKNEASVAATRVLFEFPLTDQSGEKVAVLKLDRQGTFSPGIDIRSWPDMASWQHYSHRGYAENCTSTEVGVAALPLLKAHYATYQILHVEYANGTSWVP